MKTQWSDADGQIYDGDNWPENSRYVWVDLDQSPTAGELKQELSRLFQPHPMALRRILEHHAHRISLMAYPDVVIFSVVQENPASDNLDDWRTVHVVLGHDFLVTVHQKNPVVDDAWTIACQTQDLARGPDLALYTLLDKHLELYENRMRKLVCDYESIHRIMLNHPYRNLAHRILMARRFFLRFRRILSPEQEIFQLLASAHFEFVRDDNRPYLQDLSDRIQQLVDAVDASRDGLSGTVEAYTSMQSNEINKVMKFLTIISVLALPATTIASIYGMNFNIPETHWPWGYAYSLTVMATVTGVLLWYMGHHGWFRK